MEHKINKVKIIALNKKNTYFEEKDFDNKEKIKI